MPAELDVAHTIAQHAVQIQSERPANRWYELGRAGLGLEEDQDIKHQGIVYFMVDGEVSVKETPTDLREARLKIDGLGYGGYDHFIGFINRGTREMLQFAHYDCDGWYADAPIRSGREWDGYTWGCHTDKESVLNAVGLFFEEMRWFDSLPFTMRRHRYKAS